MSAKLDRLIPYEVILETNQELINADYREFIPALRLVYQFDL